MTERARELFEAHRLNVYRRTDRLFAWLMVAQWAASILVALIFSPYGWKGSERSVHFHVYTALLLGGALSALPIALALFRPGLLSTRLVVACSQMLWSALLIHLTGGRIETHFHVFGSLAILAFYRDIRVLIPATVVVAGDHFIRGLLWPESVYGVVNPEWWRFLEHAFWVVFIDVFLALSCVQTLAEMKQIAERQAEVELLSESEVLKKSQALEVALAELKSSQSALVRAEKLATLGELGATVAHELRSPLSAARNAQAYLSKRLGSPTGTLPGPDRSAQMLSVLDTELRACAKIISDLVDFARDRPLTASDCPLRPLADEAISRIQPLRGVTVQNEIPSTLPVPSVDKEQFRQVLMHILLNAVEATPPGSEAQVRIGATGGADGEPWRIEVTDFGVGIPPEAIGRIFQPLFTTKTKGTGFGLAIVDSVVRRHGGTVEVLSEPGRGTKVTIALPGVRNVKVAA
jgi:two-component system, NtrC family, sensor histidine kinase HydH